MATRASKRRKVKDAQNRDAIPPEHRAFPKNPLDAATSEDKRNWQGFCEIENDPAFFNVMLREFGVQGVKVNEVFGLDEALLAMLPKPVYGLIFLFRYVDDGFENQESTCPENVWFANQIQGNACATVALLNIVMNVPDLDIGPNLESFKDFTKDFTPVNRGEQLVHFEFVKTIHNSFARKIDMMNIDLGMKDEFESSNTRAAKKSQKKGNDADAAFHFIAFMPIDGDVWKLDGLDRQPQKLGHNRKESVGDGDWLEAISSNLAARMAQYEEQQVEFGLLSLTKDPIIDARRELAGNIRIIQAIEERLQSVNHDWRSFNPTPDGTEDDVLNGPTSGLHITAESIMNSQNPELITRKLGSEDDAETLFDLRQKYVTEQASLIAAILDEDASACADEVKAESCRHDYGPLIRTWLGMLAENDVLKELVEESG
ncbi:ubiquitin carboxyl-terminal hydrolase [Saccharata proteae CBS 121410]|uniref:Ubiquitin carboxyl-terminal hydrolase n=1 Tax=Saccharata proteae CBS 121410 TaxID=1314787 RepID=A0A9P4HQY0_9PEZI|nr:ubiquitin carboxyl-terminal hydrolase [Saccharata proteae CBS 121410]